MKKAYSKPAITFESFQMSSSIANTCGDLKANYGDGDHCEIEDSDGGFSLVIFNVGINNDCQSVDCYHVTQSTASVFGS